jgi:hypothetical protein
MVLFVTQDAERLKLSAVPTSFGYGLHNVVQPLLQSSWKIDAEHIRILSPENPFCETIRSLMEMTLNRSEIDVDAVGAEACFKEMVLYQTGGHYVRHRYLMEDAGKKKKNFLSLSSS